MVLHQQQEISPGLIICVEISCTAVFNPSLVSPCINPIYFCNATVSGVSIFTTAVMYESI